MRHMSVTMKEITLYTYKTAGTVTMATRKTAGTERNPAHIFSYVTSRITHNYVQLLYHSKSK